MQAARNLVSEGLRCSVMRDLWGTEWYWGRFPWSTRFLLPIFTPPNAPYSSIIRSLYNRPISGRRTKWTFSSLTFTLDGSEWARDNSLHKQDNTFPGNYSLHVTTNWTRKVFIFAVSNNVRVSSKAKCCQNSANSSYESSSWCLQWNTFSHWNAILLCVIITHH
jgi:hypothetical protein